MSKRSLVPAVILAIALAASPAMAQGLETVEPTLEDCAAFVEENGVPEERPVWENRGYSGWDVCLNMAYDGDLEGYFASADANADGVLDASEQAAYMDSVIGPVGDPDQTPLTLDKCLALVSQHGIPAERPFVDWSNRGYGEIEVCQSLAYDGDLEGSFASADANADGRLDRSEQEAYVASLSGGSEEVPTETADDGESTSQAQDESVVNDQYENTGLEETTPSPVETTTAPSEPVISAPTTEPTQIAEEPAQIEPVEPAREQGVLSAVNTAVQKLLPETGGVAILGVLGGAALIAGGFFAYRFFR
ncbi:MAG: hypothetical protein ACRDSJ_07510 [Rubrobacteraceae bacterium]